MSSSTQEISIIDYIELTNKRFDDLNLRLVTRHEQGLAAIRAEFDSAISAVRIEIDELKRSLEFSQAEIEDIKANCRPIHATDDSVAVDRIERVERTLEDMSKHVDYLDNQSRRNNVRIDGLSEDPGESWEVSESKCMDFFDKTLGLSSIQVERAHRVGPAKDGRPRTIIAKLWSFKDRESILNATKEKRPRGVFVNQDFSAKVSRVRKQLRSELQNLKSQGYDAYLSYDRIRYRGGGPPHATSQSHSQSNLPRQPPHKPGNPAPFHRQKKPRQDHNRKDRGQDQTQLKRITPPSSPTRHPTPAPQQGPPPPLSPHWKPFPPFPLQAVAPLMELIQPGPRSS